MDDLEQARWDRAFAEVLAHEIEAEAKAGPIDDHIIATPAERKASLQAERAAIDHELAELADVVVIDPVAQDAEAFEILEQFGLLD